MQHFILLTVQGTGADKFRLYVDRFDAEFYFGCRYVNVVVSINGKKYKSQTTCGVIDWEEDDDRRKKGYDIYSFDINKWIVDNEYELKTKLIFELKVSEEKTDLIFQEEYKDQIF